jgi:hypothetical protein
MWGARAYFFLFTPFHSFLLGTVGGNKGFLGSIQDFYETNPSIDARILSGKLKSPLVSLHR